MFARYKERERSQETEQKLTKYDSATTNYPYSMTAKSQGNVDFEVIKKG